MTHFRLYELRQHIRFREFWFPLLMTYIVLTCFFVIVGDNSRLSMLYWVWQFSALLCLWLLSKHFSTCEFCSVRKPGDSKLKSDIDLPWTLLLIYTLILFLLSKFGAFSVDLVRVAITSSVSQLLPLIAFFPLIILSQRDDRASIKFAGLASWFLGYMTIAILSSRAALVSYMILTSLGLIYLVSGKHLKLKIRLLNVIPLLIFVVSSYLVAPSLTSAPSVSSVSSAPGFDFRKLISDLSSVVSTLLLQKSLLEARDSDRLLHLKVALNVCSQDYAKCFVGYGFRESGSVLANPVIAAYQEFLPNLDLQKELGSLNSISTFGFSAILIELGLLGFLLLLLVTLTLMQETFKSRPRYWSVLCAAPPLLIIATLFSYNFIHLPFLYLLVMMPGILSWIVELEKRELHT